MAGERPSWSPPVGSTSDFGSFSHLQRIVNLDPEITHGALKLGVSKEELNRPQFLRPSINQESRGHPQGRAASRGTLVAVRHDGHRNGRYSRRQKGWRVALRYALGDVAQDELMKPRILTSKPPHQAKPILPLFED